MSRHDSPFAHRSNSSGQASWQIGRCSALALAWSCCKSLLAEFKGNAVAAVDGVVIHFCGACSEASLRPSGRISKIARLLGLILQQALK